MKLRICDLRPNTTSTIVEFEILTYGSFRREVCEPILTKHGDQKEVDVSQSASALFKNMYYLLQTLLIWFLLDIFNVSSRHYDIIDLSCIDRSPFYGAQTILYCALNDVVVKFNGDYFKDCHRSELADFAKDELAAKTLWEDSLKITGLRDYWRASPILNSYFHLWTFKKAWCFSYVCLLSLCCDAAVVE